ncbi:MAG: ATP-binding cassette domain-containing protein [Candidatus Omnitrophica bacterium]|nr:ATP-binding cassette domain-containing protein [Candidatus Omnitrophota bacterium]MDD5654519.1 ATP-binding cassette domain-containing protein [Candidatus Omnitrophota bacterium]
MKEALLEIKDLRISIAGKEVIRNFNLRIDRGQVMVLLGQNGSGKTSLIMAIMGFPSYQITGGDILFNGESILGLPIDKRAKLGIGALFQRPPTVRGVKLRQLINMTSRSRDFDLDKAAEELAMTDFLDRDLNLGFSGGEMKRSELLQLIAQEPQIVLLDEPESGVDLENVSSMGRIVEDFLKAKDCAALIITHTGYILDYVKADMGCVLSNMQLHCLKDPKKIIQVIRKYGYDKCLKCKR